MPPSRRDVAVPVLGRRLKLLDRSSQLILDSDFRSTPRPSSRRRRDSRSLPLAKLRRCSWSHLCSLVSPLGTRVWPLVSAIAREGGPPSRGGPVAAPGFPAHRELVQRRLLL